MRALSNEKRGPGPEFVDDCFGPGRLRPLVTLVSRLEVVEGRDLWMVARSSSDAMTDRRQIHVGDGTEDIQDTLTATRLIRILFGPISPCACFDGVCLKYFRQALETRLHESGALLFDVLHVH